MLLGDLRPRSTVLPAQLPAPGSPQAGKSERELVSAAADGASFVRVAASTAVEAPVAASEGVLAAQEQAVAQAELLSSTEPEPAAELEPAKSTNPMLPMLSTPCCTKGLTSPSWGSVGGGGCVPQRPHVATCPWCELPMALPTCGGGGGIISS